MKKFMFLMLGLVAFTVSCTTSPTPVTEPEADSTVVDSAVVDSVVEETVDTAVIDSAVTEETIAE